MSRRWHVPGLLPVAILAAPGVVSAVDQEFGYPPTGSLADVRSRINQASPVHPRLLVKRDELAALRRSFQGDPARRALAHAVVKQALLMEDLPPIERRKTGRRLLHQSRRCVKRIVTLSMAYHLSGEKRHVQRCEKEMLQVARFTDWNPSHFLDVAEMTFALAIGLDWLHDQLDDASRREIRDAIIEKGVALPFETRHRGWVQSRNNWGQVCHGGLIAGALAVMEHAPDLAARTVHSALEHVTHSMSAYAPNGSYPEGPGYWAYGTSYNVILIGVLESALGTDFGLTGAPGFSRTGAYPALVFGPSGLFFNYSDGGAGRSPQPALFWFAARYGRPDWLLGERGRLMAGLSSLRPQDAATEGGRLLPLALLWMDEEKREAPDDTTIRLPLHWNGDGETPITVHRSSWTDAHATFVGLKGGSPSANHGQMDIGSFVLDADGARWAIDLGAEYYHGIESRGMNLWSRTQDSDRWTIFRQSNHGHNTLVIDGQLQRAAGRGTIVGFSDDPDFPHTVIDMSSVYDGQAQSARRGIALLSSREVLVRDELTGLRPGSRVRWGMVTRAAPGDPARPKLELRERDALLTLTILSPRASGWRLADTAAPRHEWDSPNPGTRMVAFEAVAPESGRLTLVVLATPGSCAKSLRGEITSRTLETWSAELEPGRTGSSPERHPRELSPPFESR